MSAGPGIARWRALPANARMAVRMIRSSANREYTLLLVTAVVSGLALLVLMVSGRDLIQRLSSDHLPDSAWSLLPLVVVIGLATAAIGICSAVDSEVRWILAYLVERQATADIVETATSVPLAEFESPEFQDHLQRSLRQSVHQPWEITQAVSQLAAALAGGVAISIVLATVQPLLIPAVLLAGIPLAFAATRNSQALYDAVRAVTPLNRERQYLQDLLTGRDEAKEVRAFGAADHLRARYDDRYRRELAALRDVSRLRARRSLVAGLGATIITVAVLATLIVLTIEGRVDLADAAVGAVAVQQLSMRVRGVNGAVSSIQEASLFLEDYADFLSRGNRQDVVDPQRTSSSTRSAVEMHDVWFTYPGAEVPALQGVDLSLERGHVVALVGANGSGKTTIAKLACGLYEPQRGQVAWEAGATPRVGVIFQDFMRYELTARDNITLGDTTRVTDDDHVAASARAASADDFLTALPHGYDTWLSPSFEGGTDLSVGQWQRVAMARALFREAPVLVLDEPTAALDPSAERDLIAATKRLFADKAVLVISHRFANVVGADRIHVLDEGRVIESGSHDELMARGGRYAEMYRVQASTFGVEAHD
ncbi:MAG: ABC transporter ATP-binding protein [Aeromicrobium sp.]